MGKKLFQIRNIFLVPVLLLCTTIFGQNSSEYLWQDISESAITILGERQIIPDSYRTMHLDFEGIKTFLQNAPKEVMVKVNQSQFIISLPMPNGEFVDFKMVESPVMAEELSIKFPFIKIQFSSLWNYFK